MDGTERNRIYERLAVAMEQRPGESLQDAATRMVAMGGPQTMAAHRVLASRWAAGDGTWETLRAALVVAERCGWPNALTHG